MATATPTPNWSRIVRQMAADKARLEAALAGDEQAGQQVTFAHPLALQEK